MDVGIASRVSAGVAQYAAQSKNVTKTSTDTAEQTSKEVNVGSAYAVDISDEAKEAAQTQQTSQAAVEETDENSSQSTKGLSADQVRYLEESIAMNQQTMLNMMIQALTDQNDKLQGWLDDGVGILNFDGVQIDASEFALPEVATTPEEAEKAVADGGEWSVDAVAGRIFDMASKIAGNDPEKLSLLRGAVEQGFKDAGLTWTNATGLQDMPEITSKTYDEVMSRFDKRAEELAGATAAAGETE